MQQDGSQHSPAEMEIVFDGCRKSAIVEGQTLFHVWQRFGVRNETLDLIKEDIDTIRKEAVGGRRPKSLRVTDARWAEDNASNQCEHHPTMPSARFCFFNRYNMVNQQLRLAYIHNKPSFMERARRMQSCGPFASSLPVF